MNITHQNYLKGHEIDNSVLSELMELEKERQKPAPLNREQRRALKKSKGGEKNE